MTLRITSIASVPAPGPKLCRDCKWVERGWFGRVKPDAKCMRSEEFSLSTTDVVTGITIGGDPIDAIMMRVADYACGPEAKLWEARR